MKKEEPQFIKDFAKDNPLEGQKERAMEIRAQRAGYFEEKRSRTARQRELQEHLPGYDQALSDQMESLERLEGELDELSASLLGKIKNFFNIKAIRADLAIGKVAHQVLQNKREQISWELQDIAEKMKNETPPSVDREVERLIQDFFEKQKAAWSKSEYSRDDIERYFTEEHLASLSLEDYVLLLKRFPGEMVTHVTRQGVRDHTGHMFHESGSGVYTDSFMKMLDDGRLRSPLGVYLAEDAKEDAVARFLQLDRFQTKNEALDYLYKFTSRNAQSEPGSYADRMAVHFATEEVADAYYGSERGNEIFITYPSAFVASQYHFSGDLSKQGGGYWNDQWIWANEEHGMDLDAGLVFIPHNAQVDRVTGSRYELNEDRQPILNRDAIHAVSRVVTVDGFDEFSQEALTILGKFNQDWTDERLAGHNQEPRQQLESLRLRLEQEFGITDMKVQRSLLDYQFLNNLKLYKECLVRGECKEDVVAVEDHIKKSLQERGILYVTAKDAVSSKEFWETYFTTHPDQKPSKIVYYHGDDPTEALSDWKRYMGIQKKSQSGDVGFPERRVTKESEPAVVGIDRFKSLAQKVIEDYFDFEV